MKRLIVSLGNGKIYVTAEKDLEVLFLDRDGEYIEVVHGQPQEVNRVFEEHLRENAKSDSPKSIGTKYTEDYSRRKRGGGSLPGGAGTMGF